MSSQNHPAHGSAARPPATLLLVDDDPAVREMLGRVLTSDGHLVLCAANGVEALELVRTQPVDLVLLDLNLPGAGGWDVFEKITAHNPLVAVIIVTARSNQLFTALGAGVGALLEKPVDIPSLLAAVREVLAEPHAERLKRLAGDSVNCRYLPTTGKTD